MTSEVSHRHQKRSKHITSAPFSFSFVQDSNFTTTILPTEIITEILLRISVKPHFKFRKLKKRPSSRTSSFYIYGFGYDELHDDYKKLHWAITNKYSSYHNDCGIFLVDLANGRRKEMENPCYGQGNFDLTPYLGVLGNDLSMICHPLMTHADVWVMKEYGVKESWTKMFNIKCVGYCFFGPHFCMSSEGEISFKNGSSIIICNPKDDSMRFQEVTNCSQLIDAKFYIKRLVWPFVVEHTRNATTSKATHN
ncbi:hypothetical protein H5410_046710 [Solanum commersonii]|uniref:Uncharacterized protein n=1 Tax=Solanum commersonii TaxID=4109 RepID=A0A9J5XG93_SOLCO|nr:hypothetical protein H5410_046710 [Solanum commersonii]